MSMATGVLNLFTSITPHLWIFACILYCHLRWIDATETNVTDGNVTSVERSVSVSFDNTKIYFFGDKIEFAGEVHNRYPPEQSGTLANKDGTTNDDILRQWGTPAPPGTPGASSPMPRVHFINAECQNDYMKISILFNGSFTGMIYSAKYAYNPDCLYVNGTGAQRYEFYIRLNRCGTLNGAKGREGSNDNKKMMWNTVTVQYNSLIEEEWDEHFRVTCEYGYQFWKKVSFPVLDVRVPTENPLLFTLSPPECQMEIRNGFNLNGLRVERPVNVGDPLTLLIYMRSPTVGFDIIINNCVAHNGANKQMALIDDSGCPVESKLISDFKGIDLHHGIYESKVYAYFKAFRFTGSPALYIECDVRMCHGICPKQKCYWRNLRGRDEPSSDEGKINSTTDYRSNSNNSVLNSSTTTARTTTTTKSSTTASPKITTTTKYLSSTLKTTIAPTIMSNVKLTTTKSSTADVKYRDNVSTSTAPSVLLKLTLAPRINTTSATIRVSSAGKSDRTSNIKLNSRIRAKRGAGDADSAAMSDTLNLFQALEVRSEPTQPDVQHNRRPYKVDEDKVVCMNRLGFTAIVCIFVLVVILTISITCMLCARLRLLQRNCRQQLENKLSSFSGNYLLSAIKPTRTK